MIEQEQTDENEKDGIVVAVKAVLSAKGGELSKAALVALVEERLGRRLSSVERGLGIHEARKQFLRETKREIVSVRGTLRVATPAQSLDRRRKKNARSLRGLKSNAEEMEIILSRDDLDDAVRRSLQRLSEKTADTAIDLQTAMRKRNRGMLKP